MKTKSKIKNTNKILAKKLKKTKKHIKNNYASVLVWLPFPYEEKKWFIIRIRFIDNYYCNHTMYDIHKNAFI